MSYPVFVVCRDRYTMLVNLLDWLESVGHADEVYLLDNASTYPPLLDFYETTRHTVIRVGANRGHRVGWDAGYIRQHAAGRRFVYTDPDVLPVDDCPADAVDRMAAVLDRDGAALKCGFSIKIDDLHPAYLEPKGKWEAPFWQRYIDRVGAYRAPIDTTFALYSADAARRFAFKPAYRLPPPYSIRHLPWYTDPGRLDPEDEYYQSHADKKVSNWARDVTEFRDACDSGGS